MRAYERFLEYVKYPTMSNEESESCPSTEKQLALAKFLVDELTELGLSDARVDEFGYVYASLPKNCERDINAIGFIAHMDTSPEACDENVKPQVVDYSGGDILLNKKEDNKND